MGVEDMLHCAADCTASNLQCRVGSAVTSGLRSDQVVTRAARVVSRWGNRVPQPGTPDQAHPRPSCPVSRRCGGSRIGAEHNSPSAPPSSSSSRHFSLFEQHPQDDTCSYQRRQRASDGEGPFRSSVWGPGSRQASPRCVAVQSVDELQLCEASRLTIVLAAAVDSGSARPLVLRLAAEGPQVLDLRLLVSRSDLYVRGVAVLTRMQVWNDRSVHHRGRAHPSRAPKSTSGGGALLARRHALPGGRHFDGTLVRSPSFSGTGASHSRSCGFEGARAQLTTADSCRLDRSYWNGPT